MTRTRVLLISVAAVIPLAVLEFWNNGVRLSRAADYLLLFGLLWMLSLAFVTIGSRAPDSEGGASRGLRVAACVVLAIAWVVIVSDQWPCFTGSPNCD